VARGWCDLHYRRWLHNGHMNIIKPVGTLHSGYIRIADKMQHVMIVEEVLGYQLPKGVEVHHVDGNKSNNDHGNLVVCPDRAYHSLLHQRQDALSACGNANWLKCWYCKKYGPQSDMRSRYGGIRGWIHVECDREYKRGRHAKRNEMVS